MIRQLLLLVLLVAFVDAADLGAATSECDGTGWILYKDVKCFKLIQSFSNHKTAQELCHKEWLPATDMSTPTLVSVKSEEEQDFLTNYLFETSAIKVNVWLGANRSPTNVNQFRWEDDGSVVGDYTNWINPTGPVKQAGRDCVELLSKFTIEDSAKAEAGNGKWQDATCELANYVVCEKLPRWSFAKLQQTLLEVRKRELVTETTLTSVQNELASTTSQLSGTQSQLTKTQGQLDEMKKNPVPIGFIYTQLGSQPDPKALWPTVAWTDVTGSYAGLFFRAEGAESETFGQVQLENSPRITEIQNGWDHLANFQEHINLSPGQWSSKIYTGNSDNHDKDGLSFLVSGGEVRPRNMAIKIWKRSG